MIFSHYFEILIPLLLITFLFWLLSIIKKDVSIVDSLWSIFFIIASIYSYIQLDNPSSRAQIVTLLVIFWGLRLAFYITIRNWGHEEDSRYQKIRNNNEPYFQLKSLYLIFLFQAILAWIIAVPIIISIQSTEELGFFDWIGLGFWLAGMYFESTSDYQMWKFKRNPANKGKINSQGLWGYSRHPNYFGECLIWWGYFCFSLSSNAYMAVISPLIMTFLLLKFSGVALLEKSMKTRPGYDQYIKTTNAFFPSLIKKRGA